MGVGGSCTVVLLADGAARVARPGAGGMGPGRSGIGFDSVFGEPKLVCGKERALVLGGEVGQRWGEGDG